MLGEFSLTLHALATVRARAILLKWISTSFRSNWHLYFAAYKFAIRLGLNRCGLLHKPIEELPSVSRCAAIETKRKFVELVVNVFVTDRSLMSTQRRLDESLGYKTPYEVYLVVGQTCN